MFFEIGWFDEDLVSISSKLNSSLLAGLFFVQSTLEDIAYQKTLRKESKRRLGIMYLWVLVVVKEKTIIWACKKGKENIAHLVYSLVISIGWELYGLRFHWATTITNITQ